mmetsp:Transcript_7898/g.9158  ORF Transcript_7898/g.9158 Transcript_7898/m.9158 type:complete len:196 (-) Transcript_7898:221-808(-)
MLAQSHFHLGMLTNLQPKVTVAQGANPQRREVRVVIVIDHLTALVIEPVMTAETASAEMTGETTVTVEMVGGMIMTVEMIVIAEMTEETLGIVGMIAGIGTEGQDHDHAIVGIAIATGTGKGAPVGTGIGVAEIGPVTAERKIVAGSVRRSMTLEMQVLFSKNPQLLLCPVGDWQRASNQIMEKRAVYLRIQVGE